MSPAEPLDGLAGRFLSRCMPAIRLAHSRCSVRDIPLSDRWCGGQKKEEEEEDCKERLQVHSRRARMEGALVRTESLLSLLRPSSLS